MPAHSKIQDVEEARRWIEEGRPYSWMVDKYIEKYNVVTTVSMWSKWRQRQGIPRRIARDAKLIPWKVEPEHESGGPLVMLHREARRRAGLPLSLEDLHELDVWIAGLKARDQVVRYDPETKRGFFYTPRREGIDLDLISEPEQRTTVKVKDTTD